MMFPSMMPRNIAERCRADFQSRMTVAFIAA